MTLRHFRIFVAVCDTMNMTAAAETLYISQSAVSQAVAEMEAHYGARLFERLSRRLYLTQAGERLLGYARHILRVNAEAEGELGRLQGGGVLRVGASVTVCSHVLPGLAARFAEEAPDAELLVTEDNTARTEEGLLRDRLDLALVEGEIQSPDVVTRAFMEDELVLICAPFHPFAAMETVEPALLEREPLLLREPGSGTRKTFEDAMTARGLRWKTAWVCSNPGTIRNAVAAGRGVSVISRLAAARDAAEGRLCIRPVAGMAFRRQFKAAFHRNKYLTPMMERFLALVEG